MRRMRKKMPSKRKELKTEEKEEKILARWKMRKSASKMRRQNAVNFQ